MTLHDLANILVYIAGFLWSIELVPQIIKTIKFRSVKDISKVYFFISCTAYVIYITANIILKNWVIVYSHIPGLLATLVMIYFVIKYQGK